MSRRSFFFRFFYPAKKTSHIKMHKADEVGIERFMKRMSSGWRGGLFKCWWTSISCYGKTIIERVASLRAENRGTGRSWKVDEAVQVGGRWNSNRTLGCPSEHFAEDEWGWRLAMPYLIELEAASDWVQRMRWIRVELSSLRRIRVAGPGLNTAAKEYQ